MENKKQQWKKRVEIFKCIYSDLINEKTHDLTAKVFIDYSFDKNQMKIIEYYVAAKNEVIKSIIEKLAQNWTWERISYADKAILISAICEAKTHKIEKSIIIDQALVTTNHYSTPDSKKFINAILDKVI